MSTAPAAAQAWPSVPATLPTTMNAVVFERFGGPEVLRPAVLAMPTVGPGEVLVRVAAVAVGRLLDLTFRAGLHPSARPTFPHVLGAEHAGTVVAVGTGVDSLQIGDHVAVFPVLSCGVCAACADGAGEACPHLQVLGLHRDGAYAEYTSVPAGNVHVVPRHVDPTPAAALALAGPVAANQLVQAGLRCGDWVLVQGASSALGSLTAVLARHLGARVIGASRSAWKRDQLRELGLTAVVDPTDPGFVRQVLDLTGGAGVAVAVDDLGEPIIWERTLDVLADRGTVVSSGAFLGGKVSIDVMRLYLRNQRIIGVRTGNAASVDVTWEAVAEGFRPVIDREFPLLAAGDAHRHLESSESMGRVVLTIEPRESNT